MTTTLRRAAVEAALFVAIMSAAGWVLHATTRDIVPFVLSW